MYDVYKISIVCCNIFNNQRLTITEKVDGTYWDYVMTSNGTKGYAARETYESESTYKLYLVPVIDASIKNDKVKIVSFQQ